jgi:hypothetical protein
LCAALALLLPFDLLRLLFALPLALFFPGYAIVTAAFAQRPLDRPRLLLLAVGLSLAVLALGSLVLDIAPGGLRPGSWALLLWLVVLAACRTTAVRRPPSTGKAIAMPRLRLGAGATGLLAAAVLVGGAAFALAFTDLPAKHAIGYTELWVQPIDGKAAPAARIGIGSDEQDATDYFLRVHFGAGGRTKIRVLKLNPGESRIIRFEDEATAADTAASVHAALFRAEEPYRVYRRVSAWVAPPRAGE